MLKQLLSILTIATLFVSCRKLPDPSQVSTDFVVYTNYDSKADFKSYKTFVLPPYVGAISDNPNDSILAANLGDPILAEVRQNLLARGYTEVNRNQAPDLGVAVTALKNIDIISAYPGGWWGYPGSGGCYWGYCGWYGGYPPYYPVYVYETGSLVVEMVDLKKIKPGVEKLSVLWTNWNGGALGDQSSNFQNAISSIKQGFTQSPYITAK